MIPFHCSLIRCVTGIAFLALAAVPPCASGQDQLPAITGYSWHYNLKVQRNRGQEISDFGEAPVQGSPTHPNFTHTLNIPSQPFLAEATANSFQTGGSRELSGHAQAKVTSTDSTGGGRARAIARASFYLHFDDLVFGFDLDFPEDEEPNSVPGHIVGMRADADTSLALDFDYQGNVLAESIVQMELCLRLQDECRTAWEANETSTYEQVYAGPETEPYVYSEGTPRKRHGFTDDYTPPTFTFPVYSGEGEDEYEPISGYLGLHVVAEISGDAPHGPFLIRETVDDGEYLADAYALNTFGFPTDGPVFDLPPGVTVNSEQLGIVNNRFVGIPEPASLALLSLGAMSLLTQRRRRTSG